MTDTPKLLARERAVHYLDDHGWLVFTYEVDDNGKPLPETVKMEVRPK